MTHHRFKSLIDSISYKDWSFQLGLEARHWQLRVTFDAPDTSVPCAACSGLARCVHRYPQHGRWWRLSEHMTDGEVVQTAFLAVKTAEEHEMRETFRYRDVALFGPHIDLLALVHAGEAIKERDPHA